MQRKIVTALQDWKIHPRRKPLLLMGARQVGKTYILKKFGESAYSSYIYLNFEDNPALKSLFENKLDPKEILKLLAIETKTTILPEQTLIIFDEVQECPKALNSLKYFNESANEYHICAAGSLLGVTLSHTQGFPVGKVNFLHLYPCSFLEFLAAINEPQLKQYIEDINTVQPLPDFIHEKLLHYFKTYLFIGGMPEAIAAYIAAGDIAEVRIAQKEILRAYSLDFAKHAPPHQVMRLQQVWNSIPSQLAKENKKFVYSVLRQGARAKEFEIAIQWLQEAGLIHKVSHISAPKIPLQTYSALDFFKLYLVDVGLLGAMSDLSAQTMIYDNQLFQEFRGSLIENYAAQTLALHYPKLHYWASEGKAEIDFVFQQNEIVYPLEIKSGYSDRKKSLRIYTDKYKPNLLIRSSPMNLKQDGNLLNCPLYLLSELPRLLQPRMVD